MLLAEHGQRVHVTSFTPYDKFDIKRVTDTCQSYYQTCQESWHLIAAGQRVLGQCLAGAVARPPPSSPACARRRATCWPVRAQPQQARSQETVDRILLAADHEVGERGVAGASTTRIAARAGLLVGALYRFFPDKAAVADALAARYLEAVTPAYADAVVDVTSVAELDQVLAVLVRRAADLQVQHPGYYRLTEELAPERGDSPAHAVREHLVDLFASTLRRAGADDTVRAADRRDAVHRDRRHTLAGTRQHPDRESASCATATLLYLAGRLSADRGRRGARRPRCAWALR